MYSSYNISFSLIIPFIIFGSMFEIFRLNAFSVNGQDMNISAGSAIILAAVLLFNPLELVIFAFCYGLSIVIFPILSWSKIIYNISETINITFVAYLIWHFLQMESEILLSVTNIVPILVTIITFIFLDLFCVAIIISISSQTKLLTICKESLDWVMVNYLLVSCSGWILAAAFSEFKLYGLLAFVIPLLLMQNNMRLFAKDKEIQLAQLQDYNELLKDNNEQLLITLSQIIDARENSLLGHSLTVAKYATALGAKLDFSSEEMDDLKRGSLLHDIGKLGISEVILQKPGKLTEEEFEVIRGHSLIGYKILENNKGMKKVAEIVIQHHEQYSGAGYPNQLKAEEILIEARIVALCDALDTMLSTRPYKQGWTIDKAVIEIVRCRGTHFDPKVVDAFLELKRELEDEFFTNSYEDKKNELSLGNLLSGK